MYFLSGTFLGSWLLFLLFLDNGNFSFFIEKDSLKLAKRTLIHDVRNFLPRISGIFRREKYSEDQVFFIISRKVFSNSNFKNLR